MRGVHLLAALVPFCASAADSSDGIEFFEKNIRPVLAERCYICHGERAVVRQGGLLVDSREGLRKGGASGQPAVVPGDPSKSLLIEVLRGAGKVRMPPGKPLDPDTIALFEKWIAMGAPDPREGKAAAPPPPYDFQKARQHWAFKPVTDPAPPTVNSPLWSANPIDRFVKAKLDEKKLTPASLASKRTLIRRATYDLTGLPPTPEAVDAFLKDTSPKAFAKLIDRLLASPQYGERWGRHWLDVVRYADTAGCNSDFPVPDAWRYRNYVIRSFNEDKPYMQFLREQLAGDLLAPSNDEDRQAKLIATGYIATARRFASNKNEHHLTIDDTIDNLGKTVLGLTISCARCHDHKFDAIPQRDYYGIYGIFQSTVYAFPGVETFPRAHDLTALGGPDQQKRQSEWEHKLIALQDEIRELRFGKRRGEANSRAEIQRLEAESLAHEMRMPDLPRAYAVREGKPGNAKIQIKGDPRKLGEEVPRGFLTLLGGQKLPASEAGSGRRQLAEWITDPANPLTARVMANRVWQWHFGKGIVPTPNDFGTRGLPPTHPELLDWLTSRFVESGYSVKALHKFIMLSRAYRLAAANTPANLAIDPKNEFLWRFDRRRLDSDEIRDSVLAVSGKLDPAPGAAHPFPPMREWRYTQHKQFTAVYETDRRSVYLMQQRIRKHPLLEVFDPPDPNVSTAARGQSITPLQALSMMNSEFLHTHADQLAVRVGMARQDTPGRIQHAYRLAYGRPATPAELVEGAAYIARAQAALKSSGIEPERQPRAALASYMRVLLASDEFFFVD